MILPQPLLSTSHFELRLANSSSDANSVLEYFIRNRQRFAPTSPATPELFYTLDFWKSKLVQNQIAFNEGKTIKLFGFFASYS